MSERLSDKVCQPCRGDTPPLTREEIELFRPQLEDTWRVVDDHHLAREFSFPDFETALAFVNRVGRLAESEGHHPDIRLGYGKVGIEIYTHKIDGLSEADFILAAKIDVLPR